MSSRVIARNLRIDSNSPAVEISLPPSSGGSRAKRALYAVKRIDASSTSHQLTLQVEHGPDGNAWAIHTAYPALANINDLMTFESSDAVVIGEFFRAKIKTAASAGQWFVVDVFEVTRPF